MGRGIWRASWWAVATTALLLGGCGGKPAPSTNRSPLAEEHPDKDAAALAEEKALIAANKAAEAKFFKSKKPPE